MASSNTGRKADVLGFRRRASTTKSCNAALSWPLTNGNGLNETGCACNPTLTEEGVWAKITYQCPWIKHPSVPLFTFNSIILFFSYQKKITDGNDGLILAFRCNWRNSKREVIKDDRKRGQILSQAPQTTKYQLRYDTHGVLAEPRMDFARIKYSQQVSKVSRCLNCFHTAVR